MDVVAAHAALKELANTVPNLARGYDEATIQWIARLVAILNKTERWNEKAKVQAAGDALGSVARTGSTLRILNALYQTIADIELELPTDQRGAFLAVGNPFDATIAVANVIKPAKKDVLIVDAYMDETILSKFALMASEGVGIALLTDQAGMRPSLRPAAVAWIEQYGKQRPLKVRVTKPRVLHDRLIISDDTVWVVTQSLKDLAVRSPASLTKADRDLADAKIAAYTEIWNSGQDALTALS